MADPPGDAAIRPRRTAAHAAVDYRKLHRGISPSISATTNRGEEVEKSASATSKVKDSAQTQILAQVLNYVTSMDKQLKQAEERAKQAEERLRQLEEQLAKMPEQIANIVQEQVTAILQQQPANAAIPMCTNPSYAEIARTLPESQPSNLRSLSLSTTPTAGSNTLYCTVDISRVDEAEKTKIGPGIVRNSLETEMRAVEGQEKWRCVAVTRDPRNADRIRVICRDESELARVKEAMQKTTPNALGARILRD